MLLPFQGAPTWRPRGNGYRLLCLATKEISYPLWTYKHSYKYIIRCFKRFGNKISHDRIIFYIRFSFPGRQCRVTKNYEIRDGFIFSKWRTPRRLNLSKGVDFSSNRYTVDIIRFTTTNESTRFILTDFVWNIGLSIKRCLHRCQELLSSSFNTTHYYILRMWLLGFCLLQSILVIYKRYVISVGDRFLLLDTLDQKPFFT